MDQTFKLPGDYVAGFVDGEGCFSLKYRIDRKTNKTSKKIREYFYWGLEFAIVLRSDDIEILNKIQHALACGSTTKSKNGERVRFSVQNIKEVVEKVIPYFNKHKLYAKKSNDFLLWSQAAILLNKYKNGILNVREGVKGFTTKKISDTDLESLFNLREKMTNYKSFRKNGFKWGNK